MILSNFKNVNNTSNLNIYEIIQLQEREYGYIKQVLERVNTDNGITSLIFFERENQNLPFCYLGDIVSDSIIINKRINEELDTASITLVHKGDIGFNDLIPNNTKVLLCENVNVNDVIVDGEVDCDKIFEFDSKGKPTNHSQFIVSGGALTQDRNELIISQYGFVEPTAILRNAYTGTNSHTNMTETTIYTIDDDGNSVEHVFTKEPTNLYSMLERQLRITGWKTSLEDRTWWKKCYISKKTSDFLKLVGIGASESFNSATLYDTCFKLGKYCKRYPVLYFNRNYRIDADTDQFPQSKEFRLDFEKYDGSDKPWYKYNDIVPCICGNVSVTNNTNRMSSRIACEAQNLESNNDIIYPGESGFIGLTGEISDITMEQGEKAKEYTIKVPFPIKEVKKIKYIVLSCKQSNLFGADVPHFLINKEIKCIQYDDWQLLSSDIKKQTAYYMAKGDKKIYVAHLEGVSYYTETDENVNAIFRVHYIPQMNTRIEKGDNSDYVDIINQTDSTLDSGLWGEFMSNYSLQQKNYNVFFEMSHDTLSDSLEIGGNIDFNGQKLIIADKKIKINKSNVFVSYGCNYNIPKRSELVNASNYVQKNFIDSNKAFERTSSIRIVKKMIVSPFNKNVSTNYFVSTLALYPYYSLNEKYAVSTVILKFKFDKRENTNYIFDENGDRLYERYIKTGISYFSSSNSIYINFSAMNSYIFNITGGFATYPKADSGIFENKQEVNRYTDYFGNINNLDIYFSNCNEDNTLFNEALDDYVKTMDESSDTIKMTNKGRTLYKQMIKKINSNITSEDINEYISGSVIKIEDFEYLKDTNEILNFTFQIDINGSDNVIITNNYSKYTSLYLDYVAKLDSKELYILEIEHDSEINEFSNIIKNNKSINSSTVIYSRCENNQTMEILIDPEFNIDSEHKYCFCFKNNDDNYIPLIITEFDDETISQITTTDEDDQKILYLILEDDIS